MIELVNRQLGSGPYHIWWGNSGDVKGRLRQAVGGTFYPEFLHPMSQGVGVKIQNSRRTLWSFYHSAGLLESGKNMTTLDLLQSGQWRGLPQDWQGFLSRGFKLFLLSPRSRSSHKFVV